MFGAILLFAFLPWLDRSPVRSANYRPLFRIFFWLFVATVIGLGYIGSQPPEGWLHRRRAHPDDLLFRLLLYRSAVAPLVREAEETCRPRSPNPCSARPRPAKPEGGADGFPNGRIFAGLPASSAFALVGRLGPRRRYATPRAMPIRCKPKARRRRARRGASTGRSASSIRRNYSVAFRSIIRSARPAIR